MENYFNDLFQQLTTHLTGKEILTANLAGEQSDFVRLNHNQIRQAGHVKQHVLTIRLIEGQRQSQASCDLQGHLNEDLQQLKALLTSLREQRTYLPEDPYLYIATDINNTRHVHEHSLPDAHQAIEHITSAAQGLDLVGIWSSGEIYRGFANSLGQNNWHSTSNFNFDWSLYHAQDKAVKIGYAGFEWQAATLTQKMASAKNTLAIMSKPAKTIQHGQYRVYLAPTALQDILDMMAWGGFDLKSHRTATTPLLMMIKEKSQLHPSVTITENNAQGLGPLFTQAGFIKPAQVTFIEAGIYQDCLVSSRSAKEYEQPVNTDTEHPHSLHMQAGTLAQADILSELDTGIYINNLWYCNFSDRNHCRITGMTRFACFWVENGEIQAPLNVMRFDDSIYHLLGDHLLGLTQDREFIFDPSSYEQRSTTSYLLPGALIDGLCFTL